MLAAEHVLCYLRGTWNQTIRYSRDSHENLNVLWGWVDADWAGDTDTRRSRQAGQEAISLTDFGFSQIQATLLYEDNLACVAMSENPVRRKFSRHIDIRKYFVRELVSLLQISRAYSLSILMLLTPLAEVTP